jgi:hypothetical protein
LRAKGVRNLEAYGQSKDQDVNTNLNLLIHHHSLLFFFSKTQIEMRDGTDSLFFIWVGIEAGFAVRVRQIRYP